MPKKRRDPNARIPRELLLSNTELPRPHVAWIDPAAARSQRRALAVVLVLAAILVGLVVSTLLKGLLLGAIFAFSAQAWYAQVAHRLGGRRPLAAALVTLLFGAVFGLALGLALQIIGAELAYVGSLLQARIATGSLEAVVGRDAARFADRIGIDRALL